MVDIYTNAVFDSPEINPENLVETMEAYVKRLEKTAKDFKNITKYLKTKKIKILGAKGFPYAGKFSVDEIDVARLKKEGLIVDMTENPTMDNPAIYLDEDLDEAISDLDVTSDEMPIIQELLNQAPHPTIDISEDEIEEKSSLVNLSQILSVSGPTSFDEDEEFAPGTLVVDVRQVGEHEYSFNLTVADLNDDPTDVKFNREKAQFEYKCGGCEELHIESISSVYRSLKTTTALLSNLMAMIKKPKELAIAIEFIDHDLRLLQNLVAFDYALDDHEGEVTDEDDEDDEDFEADDDDDCDHEGCDHDDEDSEESDSEDDSEDDDSEEEIVNED